MGGRSRHYDIDLRCYVENTLEKSIKIEFKNGGFKLTDLPQILSLRARFPIIDESYDKFYYENYLDQYILCDEEITEIKPSLETYLQKITSVNYDIHPFFEQLRKYENNHKNTKNEIVNKSITDYLQRYGNHILLDVFIEKIKNTQLDKVYILWKNSKFWIDGVTEEETNNISLHLIGKNFIELKSNFTYYRLLLRWRNHKGILNPAWQISIRRDKKINDNQKEDNTILNMNNEINKQNKKVNTTGKKVVNICEKCNKVFTTKSGLQAHMKRKTPCFISKPEIKNQDEFSAISKKFNSNLSKEKRLKEGIFFTPKKARDILFNKLPDITPLTILEPSFGSGEFIYDIKERYPNANIIGVEKNEDMYNSVSCDGAKLVCSDFLEWEGKADLIVGNPPYFIIKQSEMTESMSKLSSSALTGRNNIYILFLYKCLEFNLNDNGILAFIIPTSIYNCSYYQPMRDYIANNTTILHLETLSKVGFYETGQETCLLILQKNIMNKDYIFIKEGINYISPYYKQLYELSHNSTTIHALGLAVKTGNIVWNQVKNKLADEGTLLIYSSNIVYNGVDSDLILNNLKGGIKKQYVSGINKQTINEPVILVERGYGNSYNFNSVYMRNYAVEYYVENHINVIYARDNISNLQIVYDSLRDDRTRKFVSYFIGNGSVSTSDLERIIPIFV